MASLGLTWGYREQHWVVARSVLDPTGCMAGIQNEKGKRSSCALGEGKGLLPFPLHARAPEVLSNFPFERLSPYSPVLAPLSLPCGYRRISGPRLSPPEK